MTPEDGPDAPQTHKAYFTIGDLLTALLIYGTQLAIIYSQITFKFSNKYEIQFYLGALLPLLILQGLALLWSSSLCNQCGWKSFLARFGTQLSGVAGLLSFSFPFWYLRIFFHPLFKSYDLSWWDYLLSIVAFLAFANFLCLEKERREAGGARRWARYFLLTGALLAVTWIFSFVLGHYIQP